MIRLLLVRHGVTEWNQVGRYQGHQDIPLSEAGREQARRLAARLRAETITAAYSSDMQRATETASTILGERGIELQRTPALREMAFGAWEGLTARDVAERFPEEWAAWIRDPVTARPPGGGEDLVALHARVTGFFESLVRAPRTTAQPLWFEDWHHGPDRTPRSSEAESAQPDWFTYRAAGQPADNESPTILVVSHGGTVRALLAHLFEVRIELYWRFGIRPSSVSILDLYPEGAVAEVIGDTSHLAAPSCEPSAPTLGTQPA